MIHLPSIDLPKVLSKYQSNEKTTAISKVHIYVIISSIFSIIGIIFSIIGIGIKNGLFLLTYPYATALIVEGVVLTTLGIFFIFLYQNSSENTFAPIGIKNVSRNCWLHSLLQVVMTSKTLKQMLTGSFNPFSQSRVLSQFIHNYEKMQRDPKNLKIELDSQYVREALSSIFPKNINPQSNTEEDPIEVLSLLFSYFNPSSSTLQIDRQYKAIGRLPEIQDRRLHKNIRSKNERIPNLLLLDLKGGKCSSLLKALATYFDDTHPDAEGGRYKGSDGRAHLYPLIREKKTLNKPPQELFICLKRFTHTRTRSTFSYFKSFFLNDFTPQYNYRPHKLTHSIDIQEDIEFSREYFKSGKPQKYTLKSFIVHSGSSTQNGHYVSYIKKNNKWYRCDDDKIAQVGQWSLFFAKRKAYFCHFAKVSSSTS